MKTTRNRDLLPRKAKESGSVPPRSKSLQYKSQKDNEEIVDDVQDSDREMEDYSEESVEDEGSIYAPTETTGELDEEDYSEESVEDEGSIYAPTEATGELDEEDSFKDEDLMELPLEEPCKFLVLLPRELRDKIYGHVLRLGTPISTHNLRINIKCKYCPKLTDTAKEPTWQSQIHEARHLLRTCRQIRDEGKQIFYEVNSWTLQRARLRQTPSADSSAMFQDTQNLFDRLRQIKATKHFKHVKMQIPLSPLAYCDFSVPESVALDDPVSIHLFELSHHPRVIAFHKLDETAQCELFRAALNGLVINLENVFPTLRSITLEVSLHAKRLVLGGPQNPVDRCGITFHVRIKLGLRNIATPTCRYNMSLPIWIQGGVVHSPCFLQSVKNGAHNQSLPDVLNDPRSSPLLEPRRGMLDPLKQLPDVHSVEVERCWTVHYRQQRIEDGIVVICAQPLRQVWQFPSVGDMLERAGPGFGDFLDPALDYLKISRDDVIEIIENTTEDFEHHLIA